MKKSNDRPTRILNAAGGLMTRYGYDKTSMDDIASEAGVSKGALYLEWSGKEALFDALLEYEMKLLLLDLQERVEADPNGGSIAALYAHTLLALQDNPLMSALYTHDGRVLGDFVHRQDPERYTRRLLMSQESIAQMQEAGLLRSDIRPEVIAYTFSLLALGFMSISSIIPAQKAPSLTESAQAVSAMVQSGLALPEGDPGVMKVTTLKMLELMLAQYAERGKNDD
jgi:TetR/AcrR family acrAB operon transcriptional repressor